VIAITEDHAKNRRICRRHVASGYVLSRRSVWSTDLDVCRLYAQCVPRISGAIYEHDIAGGHLPSAVFVWEGRLRY
jgi:hypothetical protein